MEVPQGYNDWKRRFLKDQEKRAQEQKQKEKEDQEKVRYYLV